MSTNVHITHINDTIANARSYMDEWQYGCLTDNSDTYPGNAQDDAHCHTNASAAKIYVEAMSKWINPTTGAETYLDVQFNDIYAGNDLYVTNHIYHTADTDTYFSMETDKIVCEVGGVTMFDFVEDGTQDYVEFNPAGSDVDFMVAASGITNALFISGSDGNIGINCASSAGYRVKITDTTNPQLWLYNNSFYHASMFVNSTGDLQINPTSGNLVIYEDDSTAKLYIASDTDNGSADKDAMLIFWSNGMPPLNGGQTGYIGFDEGVGELRMGYGTGAHISIDSSGDVFFGNSLHMTAPSTFYVGDDETNTSYKFVRDGTDLVFYRRESGAWVEKFAITA